MEIVGLGSISDTRILLYYVFVGLGAFHFVYKFGLNRISLFVLLIFWEGIFGFLAKNGFFNYDLYKIAVLSYAIIMYGPNIFEKKNKTDVYINIAFLLFSIFYWTTYFLNIQPIFTVASQFSIKYVIPFLFYHAIKDMVFSSKKTNYLLRLFLYIIYLQVAFSVLKVFIFGVLTESIVGSIQGAGGGTAVVLPVLSYFLFYLFKNGRFDLKDWLIITSFMIVAVASNKRAPVFIFPLFIFFTLTYVQKSIRAFTLLKYIPVVFILFYFGVKTNPSLNPEKSTWGSFNLRYAIDYALYYNFQTDNLLNDELGGRGGGLVLIFNPESLNLKSIDNVLFGHGVADVVTRKYGKFVGGSEYGLIHEGAIGVGAGIRKIYMLGYVGLISYLLLVFSYLRIIKNKKFVLAFLGLFFYDFFLYGDILFTHNSLAALAIFICLFSSRYKIRV